MADKDIQMKHYNGTGWDNLNPFTNETNIHDSNGNSLPEKLQNILDNINTLQKKGNNSRGFQFALIDYQSKIGQTVTSITGGAGSRYPQSVVIDYDNGYYYVARQTSGNYNDQRIYKYNLSDNTLVNYQDVPTAEWVYLEGLALFHNTNGQTCFIIPTQRSGEFGIFNYDTNTLERTMNMEGSFKVSIDNNRKYFICSKHEDYNDLNETFNGVLLYDLQSVINGTPTLIKEIGIYHDDAYKPKTQTLTMIDEYLYFGQGVHDASISVFDTSGNKLYYASFDKRDILNLVGGDTSENDPIMENEGMTWIVDNGVTYPVYAYLTQGQMYIVKMNDLTGTKINHSVSDEGENGLYNLSKNPIFKMLGSIGNAVLRIEPGEDLQAKIMNDIESDGFYTFFADANAINVPISGASIRGFIQVDRFINGVPDIFSIICQDYNGSIFSNYYDANSTPQWRGWSHIGGFNVDVLNSTTFDPLTANPGTYETKSGVNDPTGGGFGAIKEYRITASNSVRRQILCFYNDNGHLYYASVATDGSKIGWYEINRTVIG